MIVEVPLLYEKGLGHLFDSAVVVYCNEGVSLKRLVKKYGLTEIEAAARINMQLPVEKKKKMADYVIFNNNNKGGKSALKRQVAGLCRKMGI